MASLRRLLRRRTWPRGLEERLTLSAEAHEAGYRAGYEAGRAETRERARSLMRQARDSGRRQGRREVLEVVDEMAPRVADQAALSWADGLQDAGFDMPDEGEADAAVGLATWRIRAAVEDAFRQRVREELQVSDWRRETERLARRPTVDDALRR